MPPCHQMPSPAGCARRPVALARSVRTPDALTGDFGPSARTIPNWIGHSETDAGKRGGWMTALILGANAIDSTADDFHETHESLL